MDVEFAVDEHSTAGGPGDPDTTMPAPPMRTLPPTSTAVAAAKARGVDLAPPAVRRGRLRADDLFAAAPAQNAPAPAAPARAVAQAPQPVQRVFVPDPDTEAPACDSAGIAAIGQPAASVDEATSIFEVAVAANSLWPKNLSVHADRIEWGEDVIRFDEVQHFAYEIYRHRTAIVPAHTGYVLALWTADREHSIELVSSAFSRRSTKADTEMMFQALVAIVHARVGERLNREFVQRLRNRETVTIGKLKLRWSGLVYKRRFREHTLSWDEVAGAEFVAGNVVLHRVHKDETRPFFKIPMAAPDAVLMPDLVHLAAAALNNRQLRRAQIQKVAADEARRRSGSELVVAATAG